MIYYFYISYDLVYYFYNVYVLLYAMTTYTRINYIYV
jgi:hypothetical protein